MTVLFSSGVDAEAILGLFKTEGLVGGLYAYVLSDSITQSIPFRSLGDTRNMSTSVLYGWDGQTSGHARA